MEGETDVARLRVKMLELIEAVGGVEMEYIAFVASGTVDEVRRIEGPTMIVLSGRVNHTRLLHNCQIGV